MAKECSTDQRFIWRRNTTYKIHTLVTVVCQNLNKISFLDLKWQFSGGQESYCPNLSKYIL